MRLARALPVERPEGPLTGYKLAFAAVSADRQDAGFTGLSIGAPRVYGVVADASCPWSRRHSPPKRACSCGFYCVHGLEAARAMACDTNYQSAVILDVVASGRFLRYERGFRYARQRVTGVRVGRCQCGRPAVGLRESGSGLIGWRRLQPTCAGCRPWTAITFADFAAQLGGDVVVKSDDGRANPAPNHDAPSLAVVAAEIALLQARIDELQAEVVRLSRHQS